MAMRTEQPARAAQGTATPPTIDDGLLTVEETVATLGAVLGGRVMPGELRAAAEALRDAQAARWEQLPPEINPDVGFHYGFLACTEVCWLGRQVIVEGATFRIFRLRESPT